MSGLKGGGGTTFTPQSTRQVTELDPRQEAALAGLIPQIQERGQTPTEFFPGQTLADQNEFTGFGQGQALRAGARIGRFAGDVTGALQQGLNLDLVNDPRTTALADAVTAPLERQFQEQVLPAISSGATAAGAFGGSRQGLQTAAAGREFGKAVGETRAGVLSDAFRTQLAHQLQSAQLAPMAAQLQLLPSQISQDVGAQRTARAQQEIDAARERHEFEQFEPETRIDRLLSRLTGINLGGSTTAATQRGDPMSLFANPGSSFGSPGGTGSFMSNAGSTGLGVLTGGSGQPFVGPTGGTVTSGGQTFMMVGGRPVRVQ